MTDAQTDPRREAVLAELRAASLRARLWQADIDAIGVSLRYGLISTQHALDAMRDLGIRCHMEQEPQPGDTIGARHAA